MTEEGIGIEPQRLRHEELHARAWAVVQPLFEQAEENARDVYKHWQGTESDRVSNDVRKIVQAAAFGRVEGLFVARDEQQWGTFDECANEFSRIDRGSARDGPEQPLEAHFTAVSDLLRGVYDNSLVHPRSTRSPASSNCTMSSSQGIGIFWREQPCRPWSTRAGYSSSIGPTCPMPVPWRQCFVGRHCQLACRSL